jgi:alkanesulfonate monooxygenase SsuD/methylene tetrahydromethanopterin reductase-like flavin-dependent oxidoreductase (luciferase family)
MEFGLFNSACVLPQFDGDEHRRIMDEVAVVRAADRVGFKYTWATEHHFLTEYSHLSANEVFLGFLAAATERIHLGSGIFNITPPVNHPAVAERVALLDHLSEGRFEFGMGAVRPPPGKPASGSPIPRRPDHVRRGGRGVPAHVATRVPGLRGRLVLRARPQRAAAKPYTKPHRRCGCGGSPSTFRRPRRWASASCASMGGPEPLEAAHRKHSTEKEIEFDLEPVGDYVNDNIMVTTQLLCPRDGARVGDRADVVGR